MANYEHFAGEDILDVTITKLVKLWIEVNELCESNLVGMTDYHQGIGGFDLI